MRNRWLVLIAVASLCLNAGVVGAYLFRQLHHGRPHRQAERRLPPELREKMRQFRAEAMPEFVAQAGRAETIDSLLWAEMGGESTSQVRVESLCRELGVIHGELRLLVFRQMHRELELLPPESRAEYIEQMMRMRPGPAGIGRRFGRMVGRNRGMMGPGGPPPGMEPPPDEPPPGGPGK
jgi:hypothetical protein